MLQAVSCTFTTKSDFCSVAGMRLRQRDCGARQANRAVGFGRFLVPILSHCNVLSRTEHEPTNVERIGERVLAQGWLGSIIDVAAGIRRCMQLDDRGTEQFLRLSLNGINPLA